MKLGQAIEWLRSVCDPDGTGNDDIDICLDVWVQDDFYDYGEDGPIADDVWAKACDMFSAIMPANDEGVLFLNGVIDELRSE